MAEWIKLTGEKQLAQLAPHQKAGRGPGGINAAVRDLGIDRTEARRADKIAGMTLEAKEAATAAGRQIIAQSVVWIMREQTAISRAISTGVAGR